MTTPKDLLDIIRNGKNSGVEFRRDGLRSEELAKDLAAFSNVAGGMVLLGVEDDGTVSGLEKENVEEWAMAACRDKIRPAVVPFFETVENVSGSKDVAVIRVLRGLNVHGQWHNDKNTYYIRAGSQSLEPTPQELSDLFRQSEMTQADFHPVSGTTIEDLDMRRLKDYFGRVREQEMPDDSDVAEWKKLLANTNIMAEEGATLAGILFFGKNPNRYLPQAGIDAAAFEGEENDSPARETMQIRGPAAPLMNASGQIVESGIVEQALNSSTETRRLLLSPGDGPGRKERTPYPEEAVREATVNALIHRDYLLAGANVELSIYENRLEIISPGKLPDRVTTEKMRAGIRNARNPFLKDLMRDYKHLGRPGAGLPKKIVGKMKEHNQTEPDLIEENDRFLVRLFK